ncbi:Protein spire 2, partial [Characodon lateralis]|nr:Protein spire 2 [Characodon lateralis]
LVQSLGVAIYRALDWGLDDNEERELSPQLERLIEQMAGGVQGEEDVRCVGSGASDEGYSGQEEEEEEDEQEGAIRPVCSFRQVVVLCASRLANPTLAPEHYQAVCRALFVETLELRTFLVRIRDAKEMLKKISSEEVLEDRSTAELDALKHRDWARLWVQLMKELRQGVKLKKVQEQPFNPLPTEFSLTPFEMLMQDIRARKFQLRKVMVDGDIPTRVKRSAHELILDFIRSRPPLKPVSERSLPPPPPQQQSLHDQVLAEIKQERKLRPVVPHTAR